MTPEISHRCVLCGAAIRPGLDSCPNCGQEDFTAPVYAPAEEDAPAPEPTPDEPAAPVYTPAAPPETFPENQDPLAETPLPEPVEAPEPAPPPVTVLSGPPPVYKRRRRYRPPTLSERLAYRLEQLRGASKQASRKVAPAVEQMRDTSNVVLDRAADDPSARFLIIGALLLAVAAFVFFVSFFWG
jgi:predicted  nucleic acid-binding Zn-ribbon protein